MKTYDDFLKARASKRIANNKRIRGVMRGLTPKTADLIFDLSMGEKGKKLDINRRANVKAMELVADLVSSFGLPMRPRLQYQGMIKNATDKNGDITDGVVRVGVILRTLMGHKAHIDVPVIVRESSLLEPAVFFYDQAPYVLCGPALEELVRRGGLTKEVVQRSMYQGPVSGIPIHPDKLPRQPVTNTEHMFSPGARNPWTFRRYSAKDTKLETWKNIDKPAAKEDWGLDPEQRDEHIRDWMNLDKRADIEFINLVDLSIYSYDNGESGFGEGKININEEAFDLRFEWSSGTRGTLWYLDGRQLDVDDPTAEELDKLITDLSPSTSLEHFKFEIRNNAPTELIEIDEEDRPIHQAQKRPDPRKRTNIDVPTEFPELWPETPENYLDVAERTRKDLICPGDEVTLQEDVQARERGGAYIVVPSGEKGKVLRDMEGNAKILYVNFPALCLSTPVPTHLLKTASVTPDQVKYEVRQMLREGYQEVDIKDAIKRKYPDQAEEVLADL